MPAPVSARNVQEVTQAMPAAQPSLGTADYAVPEAQLHADGHPP